MPVCMSQMLAVVACRGTATVVVAGGKETKDLRFCKLTRSGNSSCEGTSHLLNG